MWGRNDTVGHVTESGPHAMTQLFQQALKPADQMPLGCRHVTASDTWPGLPYLGGVLWRGTASIQQRIHRIVINEVSAVSIYTAGEFTPPSRVQLQL